MAYVYKLFNRTELTRIEEEMKARLTAWSSEWLGCSELAITLVNSDSAPDEVIERALGSPPVAEWAGLDDRLIVCDGGSIGQLLSTCFEGMTFPKDEPSCVCIEELQAELCRSLTRAVTRSGNTGESHQLQWRARDGVGKTGSGWLFVQMEVKGQTIRLFVSGAVVGDYPEFSGPPRSSGVQLRKMLGSESVALSASLGHIELSIGDFRSLQVGDVLILDKKIREKVSLSTHRGNALCSGNLGASNNRKAIKVTI